MQDAADGPLRARGLTDNELKERGNRTFSGLGSAILAVSGGADSLVLLLIAEQWRGIAGHPAIPMCVATVDHGLRAASAEEAAQVKARAAAVGLSHHTLLWEGNKPKTGVQAAARNMRYRLFKQLAEKLTLPHPVGIVLGHHLDDQAETLLMRLARGSGIDGLAAMPEARPLGDGVRLVRPLLDLGKARLVATLAERGLGWIEDPSNDDAAFERVRIRRAMAILVKEGVGAEGLATSARRLARAASALEQATDELVARSLALNGGAYGAIGLHDFLAAPAELQLRVLQRLLHWFGDRGREPQLARQEALLERIAVGQSMAATLQGCKVVIREGRLLAFREPGRHPLPSIELAPGSSALWDNRFMVRASAAYSRPVRVSALPATAWSEIRPRQGGETNRAAAMPRQAALSLPSFWDDARLLAVPHPLISIGAEFGFSADFSM